MARWKHIVFGLALAGAVVGAVYFASQQLVPPPPMTNAVGPVLVSGGDVFYVAHEGDAATSELLVRRKGAHASESIAVGLATRTILAADEGCVYVASDETIRAVPKSGGASQTIAPGAHDLISAFAVDRDRVYFADGKCVARADKFGAATETIACGVTYVRDIAIDEGFVYWLDEDDVMKAPKSGGPAVRLAPAGKEPRALVVDAATVHWVHGSCVKDGTFGEVLAVAKTGGPERVVQGGLECPLAMTSDASYLYVATEPSASRPKDDMDFVTPLVSLLGEPGTITSIRKSDGAIATVAAKEIRLRGVAVDGRDLYWVAGATVHRAGSH